MTALQALALGVVQGLTELLPISSSAHLNVIPWIFEWNIPESFDVALHFGTLIAIVLFFNKEWVELIKEGMQIFKNDGFLLQNKKCKMFWYIFLATIPGGIIGFLLDHAIGNTLSNKPLLIAIMLIIMGIILYVIDKKMPEKTKYDEMNFIQTFIIGLSQALAFIPGVSRSGITMTTGRLMRVSREGTAKFSFMLSAPIVFAATIYKVKDFVIDTPFVIGVISSCVVGMISIKYLMNYLKKSNFNIFAIYRVVFGLMIIYMYLVKNR